MEIRAPLSGLVVPLDAVPDEVFAKRLAGDGVAIDPTSSEVLAPFAGVVTQLHEAHHALAITSDDGVEVLIHVGLDTVTLHGKGFTALVQRGARVEAGQPLLRFDPEVVGREAKSLLTPVVVTSPGLAPRSMAATGEVEAGQTVLLTVPSPRTRGEGQGEGSAQQGTAPASEHGPLPHTGPPIELPNPDGLHARPAAVLANQARKYAATIRLVRGTAEANAKSVVAVMGLDTRRGQSLRVVATGPDAALAVAELSRLLADGCGERAEARPPPVAPRPPPPRAVAPGELVGTPASPGLAIGVVVQHHRGAITVPELGGTPAEEHAKLSAALRESALQLEALKRQRGAPGRLQLLDVHLSLLEDPALLEQTEARLRDGKSAAFAWREAFTAHAASMETLESPLLRERAADVRDVGRRVLALLAGVKAARLELPKGAVLVAEELTPSELASVEAGALAGLCTTTGSPTGHVAILARGLGLPAVCGIDAAARAVADGTRVVVDGDLGALRVAPDEKSLAAARERIARQAAQRTAEQAAAHEVAMTRDGHRVEVVANIRNLTDARAAMAAGAEGVGLLRSEYLFYERESAPSEDEQAQAYAAIAAAVGKDHPCVIRTLDVGGDKPLPYLALPQEANPFLGVRGIRVSLDHPELFRTQLRAILRAAPAGDVHVMFPMIAGVDEIRAARVLLAEEQRALSTTVKVGVMIEVPSAAVMAEVLAHEVDFFSIGTNDLTQYTLAMDRGHPLLAKQADALHPAVLRMIDLTVRGAHQHGRWVGLCGGISSEPLAVPVLIGLGVDELSVAIPAIAPVKAAVARWTVPECAALAAEALGLGTAAEVRALLAARQPGLKVLSKSAAGG